jgi:hypothetical protein
VAGWSSGMIDDFIACDVYLYAYTYSRMAE